MSQDNKKDADKLTNTMPIVPEIKKNEANKPNETKDKVKDTASNNEKSSVKPPKSAKHVGHPQESSKIGRVLLFLAFLILLAVGSVWGWQQLILIKQSMDMTVATHSQQWIQQQQQDDQLKESIQVTKQTQKSMMQSFVKMTKQQGQLRESIQALYNELNKGRHHGWVVAEAQYLIDIANHRLYLAHDIAGAIAAFKAADQRLRTVGDPSLLSARTALADEISQLQSIPRLDIAGHSAQMISLQNRVSDLTLLTPEFKAIPAAEDAAVASSAEEPSALKKAKNRFVSSLKDLVKIRQKEGNEIQFLPPEQSSYLRQNIRLKLEVARLALLQQDNALFQESLSISLDWLRHYFRKDAVFNAMENQLTVLNEVNLNVRYPDITGSRKLLKGWVRKQKMDTDSTVPIAQSNTDNGVKP